MSPCADKLSPEGSRGCRMSSTYICIKKFPFELFRWLWPPEEETLNHVEVHGLDNIVLLQPLHSLQTHRNVDVVAQLYYELDKGCVEVAGHYVLYERLVYLHDVSR